MKDEGHKETSPPGEEKALEIIEEALSHGLRNPESIPALENAFRVISNMEVRSEKIDEEFGRILFFLGTCFEDLDSLKSIYYFEKKYEHGIVTNNEDSQSLGLLYQAKIYSSLDDYANLERICDLYDSSGLGSDNDGSKFSLWDGWKAIVASRAAIQDMETDSSSECFIATAAYGTPFDPKIDVLRNWRDNSLRNFSFGRLFIRFYYFTSPPIANVVAKSEVLRWCVRRVISPVIHLLKPRHGITR